MARFTLDSNALKRVLQEPVVQEKLKRVADAIYGESQTAVPVLSGDLKRSGYTDTDGERHRVGYDTPYAAIINADGGPEGGGKWSDPHSPRGQSFLTGPAFTRRSLR